MSSSPVKNGSSSNSFPDDKSVKDEFDGLRRDLNMDMKTAENAWSSYETLRQKYTLEVTS